MPSMPHFDFSLTALHHSFTFTKEATEQALFITGGGAHTASWGPYMSKDMAFPAHDVGAAVTQEGK